MDDLEKKEYCLENYSTRQNPGISGAKSKIEQKVKALFQELDLSVINETELKINVQHHIRHLISADVAVAYYLSPKSTSDHEKN